MQFLTPILMTVSSENHNISLHTRMNSCLTRYGPVQEDLEDHSGDQLLDAVPEHRSVKIPGLVSNTSYWLMMSCSDIYGNLHNSSLLNFTTGWLVHIFVDFARSNHEWILIKGIFYL